MIIVIIITMTPEYKHGILLVISLFQTKNQIFTFIHIKTNDIALLGGGLA